MLAPTAKSVLSRNMHEKPTFRSPNSLTCQYHPDRVFAPYTSPVQRLQEKDHAADKLLVFAVMSIVSQKCKKPLSVLLAIIFLAAQTGALAHAYEHDPGSPQAQVCSICIAGHSLSSACVASTVHIEFQHCITGVSIERPPLPDTIHLPHARQRAPPTPL